MKNLIKTIGKGFVVIPLVIAGIVGCARLSDKKDLAEAKHIQLYSGINPKTILYGFYDDLVPMGNTGYFIKGRKDDNKEKRKETAVNRSNLLAYFLLKHWDKTGENPLSVLKGIDDGDRTIDNDEFITLIQSLEKEGDISQNGRDIEYQRYLDRDGL